MAKAFTLDLKDIRSVTDFQRNAKTHVARLRRSKSPMVLTVNGSAAIVVQDAAAYQKLVDRIDLLENEQHFIIAVNEGLRAKSEGRTRPFFELSKR